jgi:heptaprenyl diphosphate synthase
MAAPSGPAGRPWLEPGGRHLEILRASERTRATLQRLDEELAAVVTTPDLELRAAALYLLERSSKRLRPALLFLAAEHGAFSESDLLPVATALELLHVASLYHDDVMDRAPLRRGGPSANATWGNRLATVAGTYLLSLANAMLAGAEPMLMELTAQAAMEICVGQLQEVDHAFDLDLGEAEHLAIIGRKTATLFELPCRLGAMLAVLPSAMVDALADYGRHLGIAFQLADDALDLTGHPGRLGKAVTTDLREGIYSLPVLRALADQDVGQQLRALLSRVRLDEEAVQAAVRLVRHSGAVDHAMEVARRYAAQAQAALDPLPPGSARRTLIRLADYAVARSV